MSNIDPPFNIVVQNEYERVLKNPDGVIMSEGLEGILASHETDEIKPGMITLESVSGDEVIETPALFRSISLIADTYRIELEFSDPMFFMRSIMALEPGFILSIKDNTQIKIKKCRLGTWDVFKDIDSFIVGLEVDGEIQF